jgi:hypothetical protein
MQELGKATPVATVDVLHKDVEDNLYVEKIESFLARIAICKRKRYLKLKTAGHSCSQAPGATLSCGRARSNKLKLL